MANETAWADRRTMISLFQNLQGCLSNFKIFAEEAEKFKLGVLDDSERLAEMKKLIDEDPNWTLQDIQEKYGEFKSIYDYLEGL